MNIAVYSDKFSGTLSATEVIDIIKEVFAKNSIKASYYPVTDGGENSSLIFKKHGFKVKKNLNVLDLVGNEVNVEFSKNNIIEKMNSFFGYKIIDNVRLETFNNLKENTNKKKISISANTTKRLENSVNSFKNEKIKNSLKKLIKEIKK